METIIQIQHLQKHFGNLKVLNDVDFDIHKGEVVTIIDRVDLVRVQC